MNSNWAIGILLVLFLGAVGWIATGFLGSTVSGRPSIEVASTTFLAIEHPDAYERMPKAWPADWVKAVPGVGYEIHIEGIVHNTNLNDMRCLWTPVDYSHKARARSRAARPTDALPGLQIERISRNEFTFSLHIMSGFRFPYIGERLEFSVVDDDSDYEERILIIPRTANL